MVAILSLPQSVNIVFHSARPLNPTILITLLVIIISNRGMKASIWKILLFLHLIDRLMTNLTLEWQAVLEELNKS